MSDFSSAAGGCCKGSRPPPRSPRPAGRLGTAWADQAVRRAAGVLAPGSRPDLTKPVGADLIPQVEHIIIYMQENRSFDHYFGMLGRGDGFTIGGGGLPTNSNPDSNNQPYLVRPSSSLCDDGHGASQSWNASHISYDGGAMDGFITAAGGGTASMGYWTGADLPFYYGLANTFPLCDRWFCSALAQTFPNRRYVQAATSVGVVSTDIAEVQAVPDAPNGLIWDRLNDAGVSWKDYAVDLADIMLFPNFFTANTDHIHTFNDFLVDCAAGTLPQVSIISPGGTKWSEENPNDIQLGEAYSSSIINAVMHSPLWPSTAMFFTYDEHGGYYDHVPPPPAIAPDSIAPRITVPPDQPGAFDRYGMRVPGIVISPFAKANYVSSVVHDHTSILKFIETKWNLEAMTYRDANADDLLDCFDFDAVDFREPPGLPSPGVPATGSTCSAVPLPPTAPAAVTPTTTTTRGPDDRGADHVGGGGGRRDHDDALRHQHRRRRADRARRHGLVARRPGGCRRLRRARRPCRRAGRQGEVPPRRARRRRPRRRRPRPR